MTAPISTVETLPFCGACGWDTTENITDDVFCDACGADFTAFGGAGISPPTALAGTPGAGQVSFAWTANPSADSEESSISNDGALAVWSDWETDVSPTVVSATTGTLVGIRVRSVVNGIPGKYAESTGTTG